MLACAALASCVAGLRVGMKRIHSGYPGVMPSAFMREALRRDMSRFGRELSSLDETLTASTRKDHRNGGAYAMTLSIGTTPTPSMVKIDTGSNTIVMQCTPCNSSSECVEQPVPLYDPSNSSTFDDLPCNSSLRLDVCAAAIDDSPGCPQCTYNQTYVQGWAFVTMGVETFTFDQQVSIAEVAFGCINESSGDWAGSAGLVGMGRGNLSLVSQLGAGKFSYCLTPFQDTNSTSTLLMGPSAALSGTGILSTPFVPNPSGSPSYYYLNLTGISVGNTALSIPADAFSLNSDGSGGLIIDSGWTTTTLVDVAYQQVRAEILNLVTLPPSNRAPMDLCFQLPSEASSTPPDMPNMTFHFDGADMVLPADNYMFLFDSGNWCLSMHSATATAGSVLGNYQQQNMHILYDVENGVLSFAQADCSKV